MKQSPRGLDTDFLLQKEDTFPNDENDLVSLHTSFPGLFATSQVACESNTHTIVLT